MRRNLLFDGWSTQFYVMALMEWVHMALNGIFLSIKFNREPERSRVTNECIIKTFDALLSHLPWIV